MASLVRSESKKGDNYVGKINFGWLEHYVNI